MVVERGPGLVTPGQETVTRHGSGHNGRDEMGFQTQFLDPSPIDAPIDEDAAENRPIGCSEGVQLALDWLSVTFTPDTLNVIAPGEFSPLDVDAGPEQWRHDAVNAMRNPADAEKKAALRYQMVMVEREKRLRDQVTLAASIALGCDPGDWIELEYGRNGYQRATIGPFGARIDYDARGRYDFNLQFPGQACRCAGADRIIGFLMFANSHNGKGRRIDISIDDYSRKVTPTQVKEAIQGPDVVTMAKTGVRMDGFKPGSGDITGETIYLGANQSRRKLRVYDKGLESDGEIDSIRWEMQERDQAAETLMFELAEQRWQDVVPRRLVSFVDFRDSKSHSEIEKRERLRWFAELVGLVKRANVYLAEAVGTIQEKIDWIRRTIAPTLAVCMTAWKGDLGELKDIIADGKTRWKPRHRAMVLLAGSG